MLAVTGSVSSSLDEMWMLYTQGVAYSSEKLSEAVGKLQVPLGPVNMEMLFCCKALMNVGWSEGHASLTENVEKKQIGFFFHTFCQNQ